MKTKKLPISMIIIMFLSFFAQIKAQVFTSIYIGSYNYASDVAYCQVYDSVKIIPPIGATGVSWTPALTQHGDTLIVPSGFENQIQCNYAGGSQMIWLRPISAPIEPTFADDTICGLEVTNLHAGNSSSFGFSHYLWSTGAITEHISVGAGTYTVTVTNGCASVTHSAIITSFNPNKPNLGHDTTLCQGEYLLLDPGTNYYEYLWTPSNSTDSILSPTISGTYIVRTSSVYTGCVDFDTIVVAFSVPPSQDIDLVTIDTMNGNNRITWSTGLSNAITVKVYREITTNNYILVGLTPYITGTFTDTISSRNQAWRYKIAVIDTCGNEGAKSSYVQSIHTWVTPVAGGGFTVQWTPYTIEAKEMVSQYNIYYGNQLSSLNYLGFVSGNTTVYTLPTFADSVYIIGAQLSTKEATHDALSNWITKSDATNISNQDINKLISIYPTITTGKVLINTDLSIQNIEIYNSNGQVVLTTKEKSFMLSSQGFYFLRVITDKGNVIKKIIVQ